MLQPINAETPPRLATGNPDHDQLLQQIAARVPLNQPGEWIHYVNAPDEPSAQMLARVLLQVAFEGVGFEVEIYAPDTAGEAYCVIAERDGTTLTADLVRQGRKRFEMITSKVPGAEYDGWEVSMDPDEILAAIPGPHEQF